MVVTLLVSCSAATRSATTGQTGAAASAADVATQAPNAEPSATTSVEADLPAGTVSLAGGPFNDRFRLHDLTFAEDAVTATLDVTSDVSEILNLEIRVDFYDESGALLGSGREVFVTGSTETYHTADGVVGLPITVTAPAPGTHSAVVSVPVLVNE